MRAPAAAARAALLVLASAPLLAPSSEGVLVKKLPLLLLLLVLLVLLVVVVVELLLSLMQGRGRELSLLLMGKGWLVDGSATDCRKGQLRLLEGSSIALARCLSSSH